MCNEWLCFSCIKPAVNSQCYMQHLILAHMQCRLLIQAFHIARQGCIVLARSRMPMLLVWAHSCHTQPASLRAVATGRNTCCLTCRYLL